MKRNLLISRLTVMIAYSLLLGWFVEHGVMRKHNMGRVAYLSSQNAYYDKYLAVIRYPRWKLLEYAVIFLFCIAFYELCIYFVSRLTEKRSTG